MLLKVIDKDKVKILIEDKDIEEQFIPFTQIDENSSISKEFILMLLNEIYLQTGVNFLDSKVLIEVVPGIGGSYYIIITRLLPQTEQTVQPYETVKADEDMYLFELYQPENIFDIAGVFEKNRRLKIGNTKLYKYKSKYYIVVFFPPETVSDGRFHALLKKLGEFSSKCKWSILNEAFLEEWGELISNDPVKRINSKSRI